jgi:hypothetical protein
LGSPVSFVASTVVPTVLEQQPVRVIALAKLSLAGGATLVDPTDCEDTFSVQITSAANVARKIFLFASTQYLIAFPFFLFIGAFKMARPVPIEMRATHQLAWAN